MRQLATRNSTSRLCIGCDQNVRRYLEVAIVAAKVAEVLSVLYRKVPMHPEGLEWHAFQETGEWYPDGKPLAELLYELLLTTNDNVVRAVLDALYDSEGGWRTLTRGDEPDYDENQHYDEVAAVFPDIERYFEFDAFEHRLINEARFSHPRSRSALAAVFSGVEALSTANGIPVARVETPASSLSKLYRAREFQSLEVLKGAMAAPEFQLGPPGASIAKANRMSAAGISMFYGAAEPMTAIAEIRPPAHSHVLVGCFNLQRDVRLLDVGALHEVLVEGSPFDPAHRERLRHAQFLRLIRDRISRPVLPENQQTEYLATQAIADFLAFEMEPSFDGMIFPSTQREGGTNVVLFHKAARVAVPAAVEGMFIEAIVESTYDEGPEPNFHVTEWLNHPAGHRSTPYDYNALRPPRNDDRLVTLLLDRASLRVHQIKKVSYDTDDMRVTRSKRDYAAVSKF